jgi:alkylation response protein AidB-like acyl-CoA dehydrogenase
MRLRRAIELARRVPVGGGSTLADDPRFQERVAALQVELKALEITQMRLIAEIAKSTAAGKPDPKGSILKLKGSELQQAATGLLLEVAGYEALEFDRDFVRGLREGDDENFDWARAIAPNHYFARHVTIVGGSNEIQRNILAKAVLGL